MNPEANVRTQGGQIFDSGPGRRPGQVSGRSPYLQPVHVTGSVELIGRESPVRIVAGNPNSLLGTLEQELACA